jgi:hypothetical protein
MVLGRRSEHCGSADVDVLDRIGLGARGVPGDLLEWVEVHDEQVDELDAVRAQRRIVRARTREQAAVNLRMQRLDAAVHDLGEARELRDADDRHAGFAQQRRRSTRRDDLEREAHELLGKRY